MIEKIFKFFGYIKEDKVFDHIKEHKLTEDQVLSLYVDSVDIGDLNISKEFEKKMFEKLSAIEEFPEYLRLTINRDTQRYFSSQTPLEQMMIKGASQRTLFFKSNLIKTKDAKEVKPLVDTKLGKRYSSY